MLPIKRQIALKLLMNSRPGDISLCREVEALCHGKNTTHAEYTSIIIRSTFNLAANSNIGLDVVSRTDTELAHGTLIGKLEDERKARKERFDQMLQEKYDALDDAKFKAIISCLMCGSTEVRWEEKQTRSADEGASVFCTCNSCKNRWVMR